MPGERIILMYISEVSGHHSATIAIEKAVKSLSPAAETLNINAFKYTNPISEKVINRIYMSVIKNAPQVWDYLYDNPKVAKRLSKIKDAVHKFNSPKLKNLFDRFKPDAVLCAQAFPCGMVADYKKDYGSGLPLLAVLTDYIPHSYWVYDNVDYYITPSEEVAERLVKKGVPAHKIRPLGIPFDHRFNIPFNKTKVMQKLKLDPEIKTVLIMGGGQGLGPVKSALRQLKKLKREFQVIVVAGSNKKLYNSLKRKIKRYNKKLLVFGYVDNINELMGVSDILISKPGGITTAEALSKKIPLVIIRPIPGQEASNTAYLTLKEAAIKVDEVKNIGLVIEELLENPEKLKRLSEHAARIAKPNAAMDIAKLLLGLCHKNV
jgi:processive 1,2-diacylglycerol beta-glucosyltransferase